MQVAVITLLLDELKPAGEVNIGELNSTRGALAWHLALVMHHTHSSFTSLSVGFEVLCHACLLGEMS